MRWYPKCTNASGASGYFLPTRKCIYAPRAFRYFWPSPKCTYLRTRAPGNCTCIFVSAAVFFNQLSIPRSLLSFQAFHMQGDPHCHQFTGIDIQFYSSKRKSHPNTTPLTLRQDKKDKSRAPISAKLVANMLSVAKLKN